MRMVLNTGMPAEKIYAGRARIVIAVLVAAALLGACSSSQSAPSTTSDDIPQVVVTHAVLGSIVREVAGDAVEVEVIIPNGKDPHDYEPSARDIATMNSADLVVANGENFEPAFEDILKGLVTDGMSVFFATEHVTLRKGSHDHSHDHEQAEDDQHSDEEDHSDEKVDEHGENDPHFFTDPATVSQLVPALARALADATGVSLVARVADAISAFTAIDLAVREKFKELPLGTCKIVTGHESLGYLADRYDCEVIGVVIPSLSGLAEATAQDFAELAAAMKAENVTALFVDEGTSTKVSDRIAAETGAKVSALPSHSVPPSGRYGDYVLSIADAIVAGLRTT
ncbi:MAG: metal ABC transporter substrate-binding protein [Actinomycetota bacterium]